MLRVGIDIGGTFTDFALFNEVSGEWHFGKTLTTADEPVRAVLTGLAELLDSLPVKSRQVTKAIHGTTLISNALAERKGGRTAVITTRGFRDILDIRRENRYDMYDLFIRFPEPLVPRFLRKEVTERIDADGRVLEPLSEGEVASVLSELMGEEVEAIAVCLLHSYANNEHENRIRSLIEARLPHVFISISSEVVAEIREYERFSTTVANAYVQPITRQYLEQLLEGLRRVGGPDVKMYVMLSSGGTTSPELAQQFPIRIAESGPAAGALIAGHYCRMYGIDRGMSFDMGGTTAKTCLIEGGIASVTTNFEVAREYRFSRGSGIPIKTPVIELIETGAGGGSIACLDEFGLLKVGPRSAGSLPGSACYGRGGIEPTVTDADLVLGYVNPDYFLGGRMKLDEGKAREALWPLTRPLGLTLEEVAWGIHEIVNDNMAAAAQIHFAEKGKDPRGYTLIAFGGAGPVHAYGVATKLGIRRIVVPQSAGVASSVGLLTAPVGFDLVRTWLVKLPDIEWTRIQALYCAMEETARDLLGRVGLSGHQIEVERSCDMRYVGQGYEINVPVPENCGAALGQELLATFQRHYSRLFGTEIDSGVEVLNWRLAARGKAEVLARPRVPETAGHSRRETWRRAYFPDLHGYVQCPTYRRYELRPGDRLVGPAIIEEIEATTVVGPQGRIEVSEDLALDIMLD